MAEAESVISSNGSTLPSRTSIPDVAAPSARKSAGATLNASAQPDTADRKKSEDLKPKVKVNVYPLDKPCQLLPMLRNQQLQLQKLSSCQNKRAVETLSRNKLAERAV